MNQSINSDHHEHVISLIHSTDNACFVRVVRPSSKVHYTNFTKIEMLPCPRAKKAFNFIKRNLSVKATSSNDLLDILFSHSLKNVVHSWEERYRCFSIQSIHFNRDDYGGCIKSSFIYSRCILDFINRYSVLKFVFLLHHDRNGRKKSSDVIRKK